MPPGKWAAKIGQAMLVAFNKASPELKARYLADGEGTQIVLTVDTQEELLRLHAAISTEDYPRSLVVEGSKVMAVGIGPVHRDRVKHLTEGLERMN